MPQPETVVYCIIYPLAPSCWSRPRLCLVSIFITLEHGYRPKIKVAWCGNCRKLCLLLCIAPLARKHTRNRPPRRRPWFSGHLASCPSKGFLAQIAAFDCPPTEISSSGKIFDLTYWWVHLVLRRPRPFAKSDANTATPATAVDTANEYRKPS